MLLMSNLLRPIFIVRLFSLSLSVCIHICIYVCAAPMNDAVSMFATLLCVCVYSCINGCVSWTVYRVIPSQNPFLSSFSSFPACKLCNESVVHHCIYESLSKAKQIHRSQLIVYSIKLHTHTHTCTYTHTSCVPGERVLNFSENGKSWLWLNMMNI